MQTSVSRAAFFGLLLTSTLVGAVDAVALVFAPSEALEPAERVLAALYVTAPFVALGALLGATAAFLSALWTRTRPRAAPDAEAAPTSDSTAGLIALVFFAGTSFVTAFLVATRTHHRGLGATALALFAPVTAIVAFYLWIVLRGALGRMDARWGGGRIPPTRALGAGVFAFMVSLALATFIKNEALQESIGTWPPVVVIAFPVVAALFTIGLQRLGFRRLSRPIATRTAAVAAALAFVGTGDLVRFMDARSSVKSALLEQTLLFKPIVLQLQPFFDADRDGYAGLLGGGDCDDDNPDVYPGAPEVPLNGLDDDCFGGDAQSEDAAGSKPYTAEPADDPERPRPPLVHRPNLVLITIDTLRADRLGAWGYRRATSPNLDALARRGVRFEWAFAQGAQTKVSMPSVFTGHYFSEIERSTDSWATIWPENVTLAERLRDAGYHTAGFPAHRFFLPAYGMNQGFRDWNLTLVNKYGPRMVNVSTSGQSTDLVIDWLTTHKADEGPYFVWAHFFDPHHFYQSHDTPTDFGDSDSDRYDEEIRFTDEHIGRLLQTLEEQGWTRNTYFMVHGDHGEGFGEHAYSFHGQHIFNDQVHVPLLMAGPGLPAREIGSPVALIDIVPTLLDLAGLPRPPELPGHSLVSFGSPKSGASRPPVFIEMVRDSNHSDRRAIIDWPWKYQWGITFDEFTLFNLENDPIEQVDLAAKEPDVRARLNQRMRRWMAREVRPVTPRQ